MSRKGQLSLEEENDEGSTGSNPTTTTSATTSSILSSSPSCSSLSHSTTSTAPSMLNGLFVDCTTGASCDGGSGRGPVMVIIRLFMALLKLAKHTNLVDQMRTLILALIDQETSIAEFMADVPALLDDHMSRLHPTFPGLLSKHLPVLRRALFDNEDDREVVQVDLDEAVGMLKTELRLNTEASKKAKTTEKPIQLVGESRLENPSKSVRSLERRPPKRCISEAENYAEPTFNTFSGTAEKRALSFSSCANSHLSIQNKEQPLPTLTLLPAPSFSIQFSRHQSSVFPVVRLKQGQTKMGGHFINVAEILSKKLGTEEENRVADDEMDTDSVVCIDDEENDDTADGGWPISCDGKLALAEHISITVEARLQSLLTDLLKRHAPGPLLAATAGPPRSYTVRLDGLQHFATLTPTKAILPALLQRSLCKNVKL